MFPRKCHLHYVACDWFCTMSFKNSIFLTGGPTTGGPPAHPQHPSLQRKAFRYGQTQETNSTFHCGIYMCLCLMTMSVKSDKLFDVYNVLFDFRSPYNYINRFIVGQWDHGKVDPGPRLAITRTQVSRSRRCACH
jgi:hypothetical protein